MTIGLEGYKNIVVGPDLSLTNAFTEHRFAYGTRTPLRPARNIYLYDRLHRTTNHDEILMELYT